MDAAFWRQRWAENRIAFHEGRPNALLVRHLPALALDPGRRVFLPLCGKTRDIAWLRSRGHRVAGAELSELAVDQLFAELGVARTRTKAGPLTHYHAGDLDVFQGDIFDLSASRLGPVDAVYDRAALVAFDAASRDGYAEALVALTGAAPQLLITFEYDQARVEGPPFAVSGHEVRRLYEDRYLVAALETVDVVGGLKGVEASETIWRLTPR